MSMLNEYFEKDKKYKKKYGNSTFLLFQVGSFFEVYAYEKDKNTVNNIEKYSEICDLAVANKSSDILMAGFRDYLLDKYIEKILPSGYTVVAYIQEDDKNNPKGPKLRKLQGVYSLGTTIREDVNILSNNISCIWIQNIKSKFIFGLSNINILNGRSNLFEYYENYYNNPTTYDCIEKFLNVYNPIEIIIIHNVDNSVITNIIQYLNIDNKKNRIIDLNDITDTFSEQASNCESQVYQKEIIQNFFPKINYEIFNYNIIDKPICLQSYCFLLNFVRQHNVNIVENIYEPIIEEIKDVLVCANHSLKQLNIIGQNEDINYYDKNGKINGVLTLLNKCITKIGKRYMNDIILNPISDENKLKLIYCNTDYMLKKKYNFDQQLTNVKDVEKILTKFKTKTIVPNDIYNLYSTSEIIKNIYDFTKKDKKINKIFLLTNFEKKYNNFVSFVNEHLNIEECKFVNTLYFDKYEIETEKIIKRGIYEELDNSIKNKKEPKDIINRIITFLEELLIQNNTDKKKKTTNWIKENQPSKSELYLSITKKRSIIIKGYIEYYKNKCPNKEKLENTLLFNSSYDNKEKEYIFLLDQIDFSDINKSETKIVSNQINSLLFNLFKSINNYNEICLKIFKSISEKIYNKCFTYITDLIDIIKTIDVYNTKCNLINKYNLCKPTIKKETNSYFVAKKMRHLLIEVLDSNEIYVPNDVSLGKNENEMGILLYGTNAVGKTSLIKSIGICVIMAQCGFYVPCETFTYSPYKYIFTRIIGNDNIFKGLSTFGVEMSELRVILNSCNNNSLILGDELCSGTEIESALSIFIASLELMVKRKSSFIFATHFHELYKLDDMKKINGISSKHLKVKYDHEKQTLYYDRRLHDGPGESIYGLEVCKSLYMPEEFLNRTYEIRNNYINNKNNILLLKQCKYNKDKIKNKCEFCGENIGDEIHHLQYQCEANEKQYINNSFHKNHNANLASVCYKCHKNIHSLNLKYEKRKTINGDYNFILIKN